MLRLRHANEIETSEANEIILINSHDGTSSYQMLAGCFRFVCQNGMITGDIIEDVRIRHKGDIVNNVIDAAYTVVNDFDLVHESIDGMKSTLLLPEEQEIFASAALSLKYDENEAPITPNQLLQTRRIADRNPDLWSNFNRVQENIIRGGLRGRTASGNRTTTREVKSIDNNVKLNKALWILADGMRQLKQA